jgi:chloride channel protein, CIC family
VKEFAGIIRPTPTTAYPDEPLRVVVHRMAHTGLTRFPVVARTAGRELLGLIALDDLLRARSLNLEAERRRERVLRFSFLSRRRDGNGA